MRRGDNLATDNKSAEATQGQDDIGDDDDDDDDDDDGDCSGGDSSGGNRGGGRDAGRGGGRARSRGRGARGSDEASDGVRRRERVGRVEQRSDDRSLGGRPVGVVCRLLRRHGHPRSQVTQDVSRQCATSRYPV